MRRLSLLIILLLVAFSPQLNAQSNLNTESQKQLALSNLSSIPLAFTENRGQWDDKALFKAEAGGATFWFCQDEVVYVFTRDTDELIEDGMPHGPDVPEGMPDRLNHPRYKKESMVLKAEFIGANAYPEIIGESRLSHNCNYFYGNDPSKWRTDVPNYSAITYKDIWPGIDLRYHGNSKGMKYDFIVNPGADISLIRIKYDGVEGLDVTPNGDLEAATRFGPFYERIPQVYQEIGGTKQEVSGRYVTRELGVFGFDVEGYNLSFTLLIDPELVYSTYLGGSGDDVGYHLALDDSGNAYVSGWTFSVDFPTVNPYDDAFDWVDDIFVTKMNLTGGGIVYSTYIGGNGGDEGLDIAVDDLGCAYLTGRTFSTNFPTINAYDMSYNGWWDVFVTKLNSSGDSLLYSTYIGGSHIEQGYGIALDDSGQALVTGWTTSSNFPIVNPYDGSFNGDTSDVFVTKLGVAGDSLIYSTYLGGSDDEWGSGIAVDAFGRGYVIGFTKSSNFPTVNPYDASNNGGNDAFVARLTFAGDSLSYSTFLGGNGADWAYGIGFDSLGFIYVTGATSSPNFPMVNAYDANYNGQFDVFVTKFNLLCDSLLYSTYVGGADDEQGYGIALDASGQAYVTGYTSSYNFPLADPYDGDFNGGSYDMFITELNGGGDSLIYGTYLGGSDIDAGQDIVFSGSGYICVTGWTTSSDFPTVNSYDSSSNGGYDIFIAKIDFSGSQPCTYVPGDINGNGDANGVDVSYAVNYLKGLGPQPPVECPDCPNPGQDLFAAGDVNANCQFNGVDVTYYVNYLKGIGPALGFCASCPPASALTPPMPAVEPVKAPMLKPDKNQKMKPAE